MKGIIYTALNTNKYFAKQHIKLYTSVHGEITTSSYP
jgi:hypothetical protein